MKFWTTEHIYDHPWETIAQAVYRKYPNPINTAVLGTDIIDRQVVDGKLYSHRLVSSKWGFPKWAENLIGRAKICYASEWSTVDPVTKELCLKTQNLTFNNYIAVTETLKYSPHPTDCDKTCLTQKAMVTVRGVPLTAYMEDLLTSKISFNALRGRLAMEWVIEKLEVEMKELAKSTDGLLSQTRKQLDDITAKTMRSMDDLQNAARISIDEIQNLTGSPSSHSIPKF